eukprot:550340_1
MADITRLEDCPQKEWESWPVELPQKNDPVSLENFKFLQDVDFMRSMFGEIRTKVFDAILSKMPKGDAGNSVVLMAGGTTKDFEYYDSDTEKCVFRQEAFFRYLFGVNEPDLLGLLDMARRRVILVVPPQPAGLEKWIGEQHDAAWYEKRFGLDSVVFSNDINSVLQDMKIQNIYTLFGTNSDSRNETRTIPKFPEMDKYTVNNAFLYPILTECRTFKTPKEIEYLRIATLVSSQAHVYVMRHAKEGLSERQLEAMYFGFCEYFGGARHVAYTCICASGPHASILHYGHAGRPNDRFIVDGDLMLLDMGGEYNGYATDITCSFPVNGTFTDDQKIVYNAVRAAQENVNKAMKPGVMWPDMHRLAERTILEHLLAGGLLKGSVDDMMKVFLASTFMPHGLGHLVGLNVHDVGGFTEQYPRLTEEGVKYLRTSRELRAGMFLTVEPGCYFIDSLLDAALADPTLNCFINADVLKRFRGAGGVRLEDDVMVTENGIENFTKVPRTAEDVEAVMAVKALSAAA